MKLLQSTRTFVEAAGLVWFLVGNMWLFGDDSDTGVCKHAARSPIYVLCLSMVIISYIQICLPCIVAILLVPVLCFCLPCLIQCLRWLRIAPGEERGKGASADVIDKIPVMKFRELVEGSAANEGEAGDGEIVEETCPICLSNFEPDEEVRVLPCRHHFHKGCVDEWLVVNCTCPSCRGNVLKKGGERGGGRSGGGAPTAEEQPLRAAAEYDNDIELRPLAISGSSADLV